MLNSDVERLSEKLAALRKLDKGELKSLYRKTLRAPVDEDSKGAGIGFIDIARRSSRIIDFDFVTLDETYAFFCLKAYV